MKGTRDIVILVLFCNVKSVECEKKAKPGIPVSSTGMTMLGL